MKIDEASINHNALRLIDEIISCPFDYCEDKPEEDHMRLLTLGEISGIIEMANEMKKVLKL